MKSSAIREAFLAFFETKQHQRVDSSSLVPGNDPTLLFTNAGMVQFKDVFLGTDKRNYVRATSSQRCVRAGGKHNDLENVGYTARHHTFFEMLGNFSFGDYFKQDAIAYAWEFLTSKEWLGIDAGRLTVTVYESDDEAYNIWANEIGVPAERIIRIGDKEGGGSDNFWQMGDTGPCGPCTEIFYDHGEHIWGGPPGTPEEDGDRFIEIWNVVFMQYERSADGTQTALPNPSIDTGMGLERIAALMQGVHSNYEIDIFQGLLAAAQTATGAKDASDQSLRVIADHIRSCSFLVVDGVIPSNEGRGYVLRRIIRRAIRHGHKLGQKKAFFHTLVAALITEMGEAYPELVKQKAQIEKVLLTEEELFAKTLDHGMAILDGALADLSGTVIPGDVIFKLYDTYGFPYDLTNDIARERGLTLDEAGYEAAMNEQRERSKAAGSFALDYTNVIKIDGETEFTGYNALAGSGKIKALYQGENPVDTLNEGEQGVVVLDVTPFYAESGGQVGDTGYLTAQDARFEVADTTKGGANHLHHGTVMSGSLSVGQTLETTVDGSVRVATGLNHSATHLLHAVLRDVLGDHVTQKGSLVDAEKLRFDFSHFEGVSSEQLDEIEARVNQLVRDNTEVVTEVMDIDAAKAKGAMALFGEKYADDVRVLTMGDGYSIELCGGTHAKRTGDIGLLRITSEGGVAAGVRRIEAVTGEKAVAYAKQNEATLDNVAALVKANRDTVSDKIASLVAANKSLEKELAQLKSKMASAAGSDLAAQAKEINGVKVVAAELPGLDVKALENAMEQLKNKLGTAVIMLVSPNAEAGRVSLQAGVSKDISATYKAGDLMKHFAPLVGGKGGGKPEKAKGSGTDVDAVASALESVYQWVEQQAG